LYTHNPITVLQYEKGTKYAFQEALPNMHFLMKMMKVANRKTIEEFCILEYNTV
jgi:hypothetical protein